MSQEASCSAISWTTQASHKFSIRLSSICAASSPSHSTWRVVPVQLSASTIAWLVESSECSRLDNIDVPLLSTWWMRSISCRTKLVLCRKRLWVNTIRKTKTIFRSLMSCSASNSLIGPMKSNKRIALRYSQQLITQRTQAKQVSPILTIEQTTETTFTFLQFS